MVSAGLIAFAIVGVGLLAFGLKGFVRPALDEAGTIVDDLRGLKETLPGGKDSDKDKGARTEGAA